nr:hypothetical protein [Tanacetum cinerariifolium]
METMVRGHGVNESDDGVDMVWWMEVMRMTAMRWPGDVDGWMVWWGDTTAGGWNPASGGGAGWGGGEGKDERLGQKSKVKSDWNSQRVK